MTLTSPLRLAAKAAVPPLLFEQVLRQSAEPIIVSDKSERLILVNAAARELFGGDLEDKLLADVTSKWADLYEAGRCLTAEEAPLHRALAGETQIGRELQLVRRDGIVRTVLVSAAPVYDQGGIAAAIANYSEITSYRKSEERYRALVEAIPIGVIRSTISGDIVDANDAFLAMVRRSREDLEARRISWLEMTPAEFLPRDEAAIAEARETGRCTPYEKAYLRKDGTTLPILIGYSMVGPRREEGIAFILDLTERQAAERALRASEQRLRDVLDNLFAFVGILELNGTLVWANQAPLEAAGLTLDDVRSKPFEEAYWWSHDPRVQDELVAAMAQAVKGEASRYDVDVRMAGGRLMTIDFMIAPLRNTEGEITHLLPSAVDITERKAAENALRASEARLKLAQDAGGVGVWDWDLRANRISWSDSYFRLLGLEPSADLQQLPTFYSVVHPDDRERAAADVERALTGTTYRSEYRVLLPSGEVRWIAGQGELLIDAQGRPVRMIGVAYDVTAQHSLLQQREIMLREVNHRVKNSLQLISSLLSLQQSGVSDDGLRDQLAQADRRIMTIARIHEHLYRGAEPIRTIEFGSYLRDLCRDLEASIAGERDIVVSVDADAAELATDRVVSLALIVNELITNAAKYAFVDRPSGRILVTFRAIPDGTGRLTIADDGRGLPEGYRIEAGPGLGMKVVVGLVRSLRAHLEIGNDGPGARFTISCAAAPSGILTGG
ncbi:MAG TPA: PAS domain S-box protein [Rhodospirillales bacterium]|nr:PAS domain S-box protein [Rhodospirillales bacterium]